MSSGDISTIPSSKATTAFSRSPAATASSTASIEPDWYGVPSSS
jgi:hypothetical protein